MKFIRTLGLLCAALVGFLMMCNISVAKQKIITTENGTKLICDTEEGKYYYVEDIINPQKDLVIPATVDGKHAITGIELDESENAPFNQITHIYLSYNMVDINEGNMIWDKGRNAFSIFPNLTTITIDEKNDTYSSRNGKVYKGKTLVAIAPGLTGKIRIGKNDLDMKRDATLNLNKATEFEVEKENTRYKSIDGVLYTKNGEMLVQYPAARRKAKYSIPKGVKEIEKWACEEAVYLREAIMPSSLRKIGECAFRKSGLKKIHLNKKLEVLEYDAFLNTKLTSIHFPSGLREAEIGSIPVKKLTIPKALGEIYFAESYNLLKGTMLAKTLVIKNPALDLERSEAPSDLYGKRGILRGKTIYAYKGSVPYMQIKKYAKKGKIKLKALKGKNFSKLPKSTGRVDTGWYSKKKDKFYISTPAQLAGLSKLSKKYDFEDTEITLKKNLDMKAYKNFRPIENFRGIFNGKGKKIKNLKISRLRPYTGLFGSVSSGKVKNLKVYGKVIGGNYTGGIVGWVNNSKISNCSFKGKVTGYGYSGKICGNAYKI